MTGQPTRFIFDQEGIYPGPIKALTPAQEAEVRRIVAQELQDANRAPALQTASQPEHN